MPDTEAARDAMRIARKYLDEYYDSKLQDPQHLRTALQYIEQARHKDPHATLKAKGDKDLFDWTPNKMQAEVLNLQGIALVNESVAGREINRDSLDQAIRLLKHSIDLMPIPKAYIALAMAYNHTHRRPLADATLNEAVKRFPENFEIRKSIDTQGLYPSLGVKPTNYRAIAFLLGSFFAAIFGSAQYYRYSVLQPPANSLGDIFIGVGSFSMFPAIICFIALFAFDRTE